MTFASLVEDPEFWFGLVCPFLGCLLSSAMFAAPVSDLRQALLQGSLGALNPIPWAVMTGNCLGWCTYGYYTRDPFIVASNLPGLVLSIWLNIGASKLQYSEQLQKRQQQEYLQAAVPTRRLDANAAGPAADRVSLLGVGAGGSTARRNSPNNRPFHDASPPIELDEGHSTAHVYFETSALIRQHRNALICTTQEIWLLRILSAWSCILVWVGWILPYFPIFYSPTIQATTVGLLVNINLIFFYGSPLQMMKEVIATKNSASIHRPTLTMNWLNTTFWMLYGFARHDPIIFLPNAMGLCLGISQGILCAFYPQGGRGSADEVQQDDADQGRRRDIHDERIQETDEEGDQEQVDPENTTQQRTTMDVPGVSSTETVFQDEPTT